MDHFVVENKQKKHRLAAGFFEPEKKTQINSVSRFENRTEDSEIWLNRQLCSVEVSA